MELNPFIVALLAFAGCYMGYGIPAAFLSRKEFPNNSWLKRFFIWPYYVNKSFDNAK
jgi:hypothetical protein